MDKKSSPYLQAATTLTILAALLFAALCPENLLPPAASKTSALVVVIIFLLATSAIAEYLTALLFFLAAMLFDIAPASVVFSGFYSGAFWLVFSGMVIGLAISITGLGKRIATGLAVWLAGSYLKILTGMAFIGLLFAFIMPSAMGRVMLLLPIVSALADHFGFKEQSNGRTGIILVTILSTFIPAFAIMPANVPNVVLIGMTESLFDFSPLFGSYFLLHFPVLGLVKTGIILAVILFLYPDTPSPDIEYIEEKTSPMTLQEKILSVILLLLLILWTTDYLHHISPAWIGLGGAILLLLPPTGIVSGPLFNSKINYGSLFFVAGVIGLGNTLQHSGAGAILGQKFISLLPLNQESPLLNYFALTLATSFIGLFTTLPGVPAVVTPLCPELAAVTGFSLPAVIMLQVIGFSSILLPYQAPPIVVAMQLSKETFINFAKPVAIIALITYTVLLPLDYLWLRFMEWI